MSSTTNHAIPPIGHSIGWFCWRVTPALRSISALLDATKANGCELTCGESERDDALRAGEFAGSSLRHISLHLGDLRNVAIAEASDVTQFLTSIIERHRITSAVLHPDLALPQTVDHLMKLGIPIGIENLDRTKPGFQTPDEMLSILTRHRAPLVLDLQHAYENASDSGIAPTDFVRDLAGHAMSDRSMGISHLHVSGEISRSGTQLEGHASLLHATNRAEIIESLRAVRDCCDGQLPAIILEGDYTSDSDGQLNIDPHLELGDKLQRIALVQRNEIELVLNELDA